MQLETIGGKNLDLNKQFRTVYDMKYHYDMQNEGPKLKFVQMKTLV